MAFDIKDECLKYLQKRLTKILAGKKIKENSKDKANRYSI